MSADTKAARLCCCGLVDYGLNTIETITWIERNPRFAHGDNRRVSQPTLPCACSIPMRVVG
eukprot:COSAG05_NODE_12467_length_467_cov_0.600543_1_plen_60_part_10